MSGLPVIDETLFTEKEKYICLALVESEIDKAIKVFDDKIIRSYIKTLICIKNKIKGM